MGYKRKRSEEEPTRAERNRWVAMNRKMDKEFADLEKKTAEDFAMRWGPKYKERFPYIPPKKITATGVEVCEGPKWARKRRMYYRKQSKECAPKKNKSRTARHRRTAIRRQKRKSASSNSNDVTDVVVYSLKRGIKRNREDEDYEDLIN